MRIMIVASLALALVACNGATAQLKDGMNKAGQEAATSAEASAKASADKSKADLEAGASAKVMEQALTVAAENPARSEQNIARNKYRHPVETLNFFGIKPDMTVVEIWPGGGWYTEVLAPVLVDGHLIAASFAPKTDQPDHYTNRIYNNFEERLKNDPLFSKNVHSGMLQPGVKVDIGAEGSADMVLTFRSLHGFITQGIMDEIFAESYKVLKPGGIFGVVEHRAKEAEDMDVMEIAKTGYVPTSYVIERAEAAGFELVEASEINANPKDTADHPEGVWTLPPSLKLGDTDREKYLEIGESDRMTLKFRKVVEEEAVEADEAAESDEAAN